MKFSNRARLPLTTFLLFPVCATADAAVDAGAITATDRAAEKENPASRYEVEETVEIDEVVADFRVGFGLLTTPERQYVAYYDERRRMTVASRELGSSDWVYQGLPSTVGWDSHNYVTMAVDSDGHLHVSGNLHADPLVYFRTTKAGDITTLEPSEMTGGLENRMTYPRFFHDHEGRLVYTYRHGGSGSGMRLYNRYDPESRSWSRLLDSPLFDGEGRRNAYPGGPSRGPDGLFHVHWVWRHTPDCATNHHLSYARSPDLIHWESAFGEKTELPIRFEDEEFVVDPIPSGGGIINGGHRMAFGSDGRPIIVYHKSDAAGHMQIYAARPQDGSWERRALTDWERPVNVSGRGTMGFIGIRIREFREIAPGVFGIGYRHEHYGSGMLQIDGKTLDPVDERIEVLPELPRPLRRVESDFPGMSVRRTGDRGSSGEAGTRFILSWESLGSNHDRPRKPPLPGPSVLRLHKLSRSSGTF